LTRLEAPQPAEQIASGRLPNMPKKNYQSSHRPSAGTHAKSLFLDEVTRQDAALVEESAAAAQSLDDQAMRLRDAIDVFGLGTDAV
jgi:hypothetical protein